MLQLASNSFSCLSILLGVVYNNNHHRNHHPSNDTHSGIWNNKLLFVHNSKAEEAAIQQMKKKRREDMHRHTAYAEHTHRVDTTAIIWSANSTQVCQHLNWFFHHFVSSSSHFTTETDINYSITLCPIVAPLYRHLARNYVANENWLGSKMPVGKTLAKLTAKEKQMKTDMVTIVHSHPPPLPIRLSFPSEVYRWGRDE